MDKANKRQRTLPWKDNVGYSTGYIGVNMVFGMTTFYLLYFYTDVMGISASIVGTLFLIARLWDAANDPIMGVVVDRTYTRFGKFRPFIIFGSIPCAIVFILTFYTPNLGSTGKVIWAFATYIPLGMLFTFITIPYHAQTTIMSTDSNERAEIGAVSNIATMIGMIIVVAFTLKMVKSFETPQSGFTYTTMIFALIMVVCFAITFAKTKKYDLPGSKYNLGKTASNHFTFKEKIKVVSENRPLLSLMISYFFFQFAVTIPMTTGIYFFKYWLSMKDFFAPFMGIYLIVNMLGMAFVPAAVRRLGKKATYQIANILGALPMLMTFFICLNIGPEKAGEAMKFGYLFYLLMIGAFFTGPVVALVWGTIPDTVEYAEWKVGIRADGLIFALLSFMMKAGAALGGALCGIILGFIEYVPNQAQTDGVMFGILTLFMAFPFIVRVLAGIAMHFYNLSEQRFIEIKAILQT